MLQTSSLDTTQTSSAQGSHFGLAKTAVVLMNLGGPDSLEAVEPFLYNLFSDPDIIQLPFSAVLQKPLAWWIATSRQHEVQKAYTLLGGRSPILPFTQQQADALQAALAERGHPQVPVYIAMRYWHPFTDEVLDRLLAEGIEHVILLPLYPQYSKTTTGSSVNEFYRVLNRRPHRLKVTVIPQFYTEPDYLAALADTIQAGLSAQAWGCQASENVTILFSAHSLPRRFVIKQKDPYPEQIQETIRRVMTQFFPNNSWDLAYQSKVGKMVWLGPDTEGMLHYYAATGVDNVLMVPISFVSEHLETLYEIDQLYLPLAQTLGLQHCHRVQALNTHPKFMACLSQLVCEQLEAAPSIV